MIPKPYLDALLQPLPQDELLDFEHDLRCLWDAEGLTHVEICAIRMARELLAWRAWRTKATSETPYESPADFVQHVDRPFRVEDVQPEPAPSESPADPDERPSWVSRLGARTR